MKQAGASKHNIAVNEDNVLDQACVLDSQALEQIYDAYFERLYRYAYRYVDSPEAAQDIASETLRRLLEALHKGYSPTQLSVWLYRVAHNLAIDTIRRRPPGEIVALDPDLVQADTSDTESATEARLDQQRVRVALSQLTPDQKDVVILKFIQGYTNAEVSVLINKPEGAVKSLQHRALVALRRALGNTVSAGEQDERE